MEKQRIPKKGSFSYKLNDSTSFDVWYNRDVRMWVVQLKDEQGNNIGPNFDGTAEYVHARESAVAIVERLID
ncbi:MAG: hypothetical protein EBZ49_11575 [Proteobacteria bacterium]|nr:hypothetical protein [Pseudomonadota bacterium]